MRADGPFDLLQRLAPTPDDHDVRALGRIPLGDGRSYAGAASGDDDDASRDRRSDCDSHVCSSVIRVVCV
jgi:hypothetical protein